MGVNQKPPLFKVGVFVISILFDPSQGGQGKKEKLNTLERKPSASYGACFLSLPANA